MGRWIGSDWSCLIVSADRNTYAHGYVSVFHWLAIIFLRTQRGKAMLCFFAFARSMVFKRQWPDFRKSQSLQTVRVPKWACFSEFSISHLDVFRMSNALLVCP